jgi:tRNA-dihydrouridine synthase
MKIQNLNLVNNILLAPMAGITDLPSRLIARQYGVGLAFTEMVSANGLIREGIRSVELLRTIPEDRPLGIQLFGEDPAVLAEAARMVEGWGDLLDINMGCPVKKVVRSGAGSALMQTPQRVAPSSPRCARPPPDP